MHALHYVDKGQGGRGQKGGMSAYAEQVGKNRGNIQTYKNAAEVANLFNDKQVLLDKAAHLAAIHKLPEHDDQRARRGFGGRLEAVVSGARTWRR